MAKPGAEVEVSDVYLTAVTWGQFISLLPSGWLCCSFITIPVLVFHLNWDYELVSLAQHGHADVCFQWICTCAFSVVFLFSCFSDLFVFFSSRHFSSLTLPVTWIVLVLCIFLDGSLQPFTDLCIQLHLTTNPSLSPWAPSLFISFFWLHTSVSLALWRIRALCAFPSSGHGEDQAQSTK